MNNINFLNKEAIMLQRFFNNDDIDWFGNNLFQIDNNKMNGVPPVNISEKNDGFIIEMAAPGYKKEDFAVNVDKNMLTISVNKKKENTYTENNNGNNNGNNKDNNKEKNEAKVYRREYSFSSFSRSFTLPEGVDALKISGSYTDGILKLEIPKCEVQNTRKAIEIR